MSEKPKKNYQERMNKMVKSEWFRNAYENKSIGEVMVLDDDFPKKQKKKPA